MVIVVYIWWSHFQAIPWIRHLVKFLSYVYITIIQERVSALEYQFVYTMLSSCRIWPSCLRLVLSAVRNVLVQAVKVGGRGRTLKSWHVLLCTWESFVPYCGSYWLYQRQWNGLLNQFQERYFLCQFFGVLRIMRSWNKLVLRTRHAGSPLKDYFRYFTGPFSFWCW